MSSENVDIFRQMEGFAGYREGVPVFIVHGRDPALAHILADAPRGPSEPFTGFTADELATIASGEIAHDFILLFPECGVEMRLGAEHLGTAMTDATHCT